jgi:uncharacterized membrane protein
MPGVFPDYPTAVIRNTEAGTEMVTMRWGTPPTNTAKPVHGAAYRHRDRPLQWLDVNQPCPLQFIQYSGPHKGEPHMSDLVVIAFPTEAKAEEVRQKLLAMQKEYLIELSDAVIAIKDEKGHIKLNQLINTTAAGAVTGAFWGALIGLIFLMPLAGAALGAASGTLSGYLTDVGIDDKWMKETAAAIQPGTAALFVLVRKVTADKVLEGLKGEGGTVLKTSLDHTKEAALKALAGVQAAVPSQPATS